MALPPSLPQQPPSVPRAEADLDYLRLLSVCYFLIAILPFLLFIGTFLLFVVLKSLPNIDLGPIERDAQTFALSLNFLAVILLFPVFLMGLLNFLCGLFLRSCRYWTFCVIIAVLNCFQFPLGTLLSILTLAVLFRDSTKTLFGKTTS